MLCRCVGALRHDRSESLLDRQAELLLGLPVVVAGASQGTKCTTQGRERVHNRYHYHLRREEKALSPTRIIQPPVVATVHEVLPKFGLAFLIDDQKTTWTITRNMAGPGLETLRAGERVQLKLDRHPEFSVVRAYEPQN